ncbi:hypothetical protein A2970_02025 [Candidatus Roizmanbacteria bacterium RIFCSPLOWO2_01_FULL_44_13]|uniref:PDZ domain-containing protein n=1 Tax=Candidatus Roizmanbacteria bacterium RIFCSPLOWO2_01_FULL_44_13 TaxID=1802069 RepID=A0A1F7JB95_9BACT|nr:MAG: hypothetical protein A2970_02025 [Candidatus Roizmanbacteria bacterium RIFCSPLOWO2_01_FULL_44_13]
MKRLFFLILGLLLLIAVAQKINFNSLLPSNIKLPASQKQTVVYEESVITRVVEDSLPSVVTVGISTTINLFSPFERIPGRQQQVEQNIGSGFIISADGLIITNRHVVSDTSATYQALTNDNKKYNVEKIYRDPLNDLAILKINNTGLKPLKLGDSNNLKLGQLVVAIGTPLGEFTNTVTSGIISGLGRGITAGSPYEGFVEKLDNVIQTDAAISPGNSGGPLLNSNGEVIGVNAAIAESGQNIGFAIPVNVVKQLIDNFNKNGGSFERPFIGVRYQMVDRENAILNKVTEGAYVIEVIKDSPADKAGLQEEDIITEFDGKKVDGGNQNGLAEMILEKKAGQTVTLKVWRNGETKTFNLTLESTQ